MKVIPFGEILEDRLEVSKQYGLVKKTSSIWILTQKCRENYNSISYIEYLKGKVNTPIKNTQQKTEPTQERVADKIPISTNEAIQELLNL